MKRTALLAAASLAVLLAACDQIRLPGQNPVAPQDEEVQVIPDHSEDLEAQQVEAEDAPIVPDADDITDEGETPTVDRDAGPPPEATAAAATEEGQPAQPSILALYNAQRCALPDDAAPTPTVAAVAGATEIEEPVAGTEAVNALAAVLTSFPGIVKLEPRRNESSGLVSVGHCGAVRVRENWLLTAAHCVDQPYDELRVIGDTANLRNPAARITAAEAAICHGGYLGTDNAYANDLALLHLSPEQAASLGSVPVARVGATTLPLAPANYPTADMAGWGLTRFGGQLSADLLSAGLKIMAVGPAAITVSSINGAGPCIGDSGGPLYVTEANGDRTVVGILSVVEQNRDKGEFCAGDYNGRYTNLQGYTGWIDSVIAVCEADPGACK